LVGGSKASWKIYPPGSGYHVFFVLFLGFPVITQEPLRYALVVTESMHMINRISLCIWTAAVALSCSVAMGDVPSGSRVVLLLGNVAELVADHLLPELPGGTDPLARVEKDGLTQIRGGAWCSVPLYCESSFRNAVAGRDKQNFIGFRVALKKAK
jgi:hypothetical protein